jgi:hypothetical protein
MTVATAPSAATLPSGDRALDLARSYGVAVTLKADGSGLILEADTNPPPDVLEALRAAKPDLLRILSGREAAKAASESAAPPGCPERRWAKAQYGLQRFVSEGWADQAARLGWTIEELYRVPLVWSRVDLTGAALMIGDRRVVAVTEASIVVETRSGAHLKFRRIGREHIA